MMRGFGGYGSGVGHMVPWMGWVGPILMLVFWALVITALVFFIRYIVKQSRMQRDCRHHHDGPGRGGQDAALEVLKLRYAKGEIGKDEFEEKRKDLS
jgi:putative membrane protein